MANYENIKDKGFDHRTTDELRIITSKGGKASGEARRRKADFRKTLNMLLTAEIDSEEWKPVLKVSKNRKYNRVTAIQNNLYDCLEDFAAGLAFYNSMLNSGYEFSCKFNDSILTDEETERKQDMADVAAGFMHHWEYRMKWYGEDEETAKANVPAQNQVME